MRKFKSTVYGSDNEGMKYEKGYCQTVSGLGEMTDDHHRMFTAEGRYWRELKQDKKLFKIVLIRLRHTRGTIFTNRLLKCIKWLDKHEK
jgi:hypothetical protein